MAKTRITAKLRNAREAILKQEGNAQALARYMDMTHEYKLNLLSEKEPDFLRLVEIYNGPAAVRPTEVTHGRCIGAEYEHGATISGVRS